MIPPAWHVLHSYMLIMSFVYLSLDKAIAALNAQH